MPSSLHKLKAAEPTGNAKPQGGPQARPDIAAIRERAEAATGGPWRWPNRKHLLGKGHRLNVPADSVLDTTTFGAPAREDRDFIAHARQDIPALLAHVEELEAALGLFVPSRQALGAFADNAVVRVEINDSEGGGYILATLNFDVLRRAAELVEKE